MHKYAQTHNIVSRKVKLGELNQQTDPGDIFKVVSCSDSCITFVIN